MGELNDKFKRELTADYPKTLAWDLHRENDLRFLSVFSRQGDGAKPICGVSVALDEVDDLTKSLHQQGVQIGFHDRWAPFLWWVSDREIIVWDQERKVLHAHDGTIELIHNLVCKPTEVERVFSFASSSYISIGVRTVLKSRKEQMLILHVSSSAKSDPTYNRNQLLVETGWAAILGQEIARWLSVPYERRI
jgi:hypothetical protein